MSSLARCLRAASVVLLVVALILVPSMAMAKFTSTKAPTLAVSTDTLETPSAFHGSYRCTKSGSTEYLQVSITSFTDAGPTGLTYGYGLALGTVLKDSDTSTTKKVTLNGSRSYDSSSTVWTIGIQGYVHNWTSGIGTKTITCPSDATGSGTF